MMLNGGKQTPEPKLTLEGIPLDVVSEFKYLGVVFNTSACMKRAAEYAARPLMAGIKRVNDLGEEYCVKDRPHAMLWLFQSFALSAGMYGSQIWSTTHLKHLTKKTPHSNDDLTDIHRRHISFVKRVLGIKCSVGNYVALCEAGQLPMHYYWMKSVIKFWNSMVTTCEKQKGILKDILFADLELTRIRAQCWTRDVIDTLESLNIDRSDSIATNIYGGTGERELRIVDWELVQKAFFTQHLSSCYPTQQVDPRNPSLPSTGRKGITYSYWMSDKWDGVNKPPLPPYLRFDLPRCVSRNMARFRTSSHYLTVETGRWSGIIQDEKHVIFECADPILTNIRTLYSSIINQASNSENPVSHLMNSEYDHQTPHMIHDIMKRIENQFFSSD